MLDRLCSNSLGAQCVTEELVEDEWLEKVVVVVGELGTSGTWGGKKKVGSLGVNKGGCMPDERRLPTPGLSCVRGRYIGGIPGLRSSKSAARGCSPTGRLLSKDRCLGVTNLGQSLNYYLQTS